MSRLAALMFAVALLLSSSVLADEPGPLLQNWTAPPYWTPPAGQHVARPQVPSVQSSSVTRDVSVATTPETPLTAALPFVAVTPCRLVDTRHGPKDVKQPGGSTPTGFPRGTYANLEIRSYDLTSSTDCTGLPAGVGAWSLQFQFITATQAGYLEAWPYVSAGGIGGQTAPASQSTMLGYTDRWTVNSAIVPAGNDVDGSINVLAQFVGDVIIQINGYYGPQSVVTSLTGGSSSKLIGDVTLGAGSNVTISPTGNTLTIAATGGPGGNLPTGTPGQTLRHDSSAWVATSNLYNDGTNIGIGTTPAQTLDVNGTMRMPMTTGSLAGVLYLGTNRFLHNYGPDSLAGNTFVGLGAGNFTMGGTDPAGKHNTASGYQSLSSNTTGGGNTASGWASLGSNSTGIYNVGVGFNVGYGNGTGSFNTLVGSGANTASASVFNAIAIGSGAVVDASNRVRIGDTNITQIGGQVGWSNLSDARHKENIRNLDLGLDFVLALQPVSFTLKGGDGRTDMGFLAQDVEALLGDEYGALGVGGDPDRTLSLRYTDLIAPLVKAVQQQQATIREQQSQIEALVARLAAIEARLAAK